jgi:hypothetical protein
MTLAFSPDGCDYQDQSVFFFPLHSEAAEYDRRLLSLLTFFSFSLL